MNRAAANAHLILLGYRCFSSGGELWVCRPDMREWYWYSKRMRKALTSSLYAAEWLDHERRISDIPGGQFWPIARKIDPSIRRTA